MAIGDLDMAPAFERREQHEEIGGPIAFILVICPRLAPGPRRKRGAGLLDQLLRGFVEADQRAHRIARALIDIQNLLHGRDESGVGVRRDNPLLFQMRFENVFLSARPIVLSLAR